MGFLFTNNMTLMLRPERWVEMYRASAHGFHLNVSDVTHVDGVGVLRWRDVR